MKSWPHKLTNSTFEFLFCWLLLVETQTIANTGWRHHSPVVWMQYCALLKKIQWWNDLWRVDMGSFVDNRKGSKEAWKQTIQNGWQSAILDILFSCLFSFYFFYRSQIETEPYLHLRYDRTDCALMVKVEDKDEIPNGEVNQGTNRDVNGGRCPKNGDFKDAFTSRYGFIPPSFVNGIPCDIL